MQVQEHVKNPILNLLEKENVNQQDFATIDSIIYELAKERRKGNLSKSDIAKMNRSLGKEFLEETIQGYGLRKPYGYAGDFLMIDKIYTYHMSSNPKMRIWDEYFHQKEAPKAVRNRKAYFKSWISQKACEHAGLTLLNLASGPARDLFEMYQSFPHTRDILTTCVDMDKHAIQYAKNLNAPFKDNIHFIQKNIFKYTPQQSYDLIWSAGLFDYFRDEDFVKILRKLRSFLKEGGEIVIGNFNEDHNPSRDYMEIFGEWYLYHRTEAELILLAKAAGFDPEQIKVGKEPEQVNLFLHLTNRP